MDVREEEEEEEEEEEDRTWWRGAGGHLSFLPSRRAASAAVNERGVNLATTAGGRDRELMTPEEDTEDEEVDRTPHPAVAVIAADMVPQELSSVSTFTRG